jgi:hypothetical protein
MTLQSKLIIKNLRKKEDKGFYFNNKQEEMVQSLKRCQDKFIKKETNKL